MWKALPKDAQMPKTTIYYWCVNQPGASWKNYSSPSAMRDILAQCNNNNWEERSIHGHRNGEILERDFGTGESRNWERYTSWGKSILNYFLVFVVTFFDIVQKENNHDTNQDELMLTRYKKYSKFNFSRALGCRRFRFLAFGGLDKLSFYESWNVPTGRKHRMFMFWASHPDALCR